MNETLCDTCAFARWIEDTWFYGVTKTYFDGCDKGLEPDEYCEQYKEWSDDEWQH